MTKLLIRHGKIPSIHETVQKEVSPCLWSAETLQANSCSHDWIVFKLVPPNDNISGYVSLPVLTLDVLITKSPVSVNTVKIKLKFKKHHLHSKIPRNKKSTTFWPAAKGFVQPEKPPNNRVNSEAVLCALVWEFAVRSPPAALSRDIMDYLTMRTCSPGTWPTCRHRNHPESPQLMRLVVSPADSFATLTFLDKHLLRSIPSQESFYSPLVKLVNWCFQLKSPPRWGSTIGV